MSSPTLYQQIRRTLTDEIMSGRYAAGDKFPPENELCDRFGVSRQTVREAIRELQSRGLLKRRRGAGTVVCGRTDPTLFVQEIDTLGRLFDAAQDTRLERKSEGLIAVREGLADLLGCKPGESWLRFAGLRWHLERNIKLCWTEIFVARKYSDVRKHLTSQTSGVFTLLEQHFGVVLTRLEQEISAVAIDDKHAAELDAEAGSPGLFVLRRYFDPADDLYQIAISLYPADRFTMKTQLLRQAGGA
ncbi:MAG: GntR family transcriptional regulator [Pseudorhodoplanes sp.]